MANKRSAGTLIHRQSEHGMQVLLVHPGGPMWTGRDAGSWQIPKGIVEPGEDDKNAARREVEEELGIRIEAPLVPLGDLRQSRAKTVAAFAVAMDVDTRGVVSNATIIEWPPRSGIYIEIPEIDEARWFDVSEARTMMLPSQIPLLDKLLAIA